MESDIIYYGSCIFFEYNSKQLSSSGFLDNTLSLNKDDPLKAVFRVIPHKVYQVQDLLLNSLHEQKKKSKETFTAKFNSLKGKLEGEISTNLSTSLSYKSQPVTFGSQILLQHVFSQKILTLTRDKHATHRDKYKLKLSEFGTSMSTFSINSAFKYQEEGSSYIRVGSKVVLANELAECEKTVFCDQLEETGEIVASLESKIPFSVSLFNQDSDDEKRIFCGNFVQLIHSEENSCFTTIRNHYDRSIIEPRFSQNLKNGNSIWVIENLEAKLGGEIITCFVYTIKNLSSGLYLISEEKDGVNKLSFSPNKDESKWQIKSDSSEQAVESERFYRIVDNLSGFTLAAVVDPSISGDDKYLPTLLQDDLNVSYFRIKKVHNYFLNMTLFLVTSQEFLNHFLNSVKQFLDSQEKEFISILSSFSLLEKCLKEIKHFCLNKLPKLISIDVPEGQIDKLKQNTLRDLKLISSLTDILAYFVGFKRKLIRFDDMRNDFEERLDKCLKRIFSLIAVVCMDNQDNQEEAFEHIEIYCKYIDRVKSANGFLISLFRNNERLLYKLASHSCPQRSVLVGSYINALRKTSNVSKDLMLDMLTTICTYEESAINMNQELIYEYLFKNPDNFSKISIPVSSEDGLNIDLIFSSPKQYGEKVISLKSCFEPDNLEQFQSKIEYFTKILWLFAGMCCGNNYTNSSSIGIWFTRKLLEHNMWNSELSRRLRAGFCKLFKSIYIDCYSKIESKRIENVKILKGFSIIRLNTRKLLKVDMKKEVKDIYTEAVNQKSEIVEQEDDLMLKLNQNLIDYFSELDIGEFDELSLELLNIVFKLIKLEMIGLKIYDPINKVYIMNEKDPNFVINETGIYKILLAISRVLFKKEDDSRSYNAGIILSSSIKSVDKSQISLLNKERESYKNDIVSIEGEHLLNYFKSMTIENNAFEQISNYEIECKICVLKILDFLLDWKIDRFVENFLDYFKETCDNGKKISNFTENDLFSLMPAILGEVQSEGKESKSKFTEYPNLTWMDSNFIDQLLTLFSLNKNYIMQNYILKVIMRCYSQRREMLKSLNKLNLIMNTEDANIFNWVKVNIIVFKEIVSQSDLWITYYKSGQSNEIFLGKYQKTIDILQSIEIVLYEKSFIKNNQLVKPAYNNKISKFRQHLLIHLNFHQQIINFIRDNIHHLSEVYDDPQTYVEHQARSQYIELFSLCFSLLSNFVKNNQEVQKIIHKYMFIFTRDLRLDLKQMELIVEIFRDNIELCEEANEKFLCGFVNLIETEGRQARFLELFPIIQVVENKPLQGIQRLVFKVLAQSANYQFLLYIDCNNKFIFDIDTNHFNPNYKDEPVQYHCKVIESLAYCSYGTGNIYLTEAKCQKIFKISTIFEALEKSELKYSNSSSMRIPLLKFLFYAYIESDKGIEEMFRNPYFIDYLKKQVDLPDNSKEFVELMLDILFIYSLKFPESKRYEFETIEDLDTIKRYLLSLPQSFDKFKVSEAAKETFESLLEIYHLQLPGPETEVLLLETNDSNQPIYKIEWEALKDELIMGNKLKKLLKSEHNALSDKILNIDTKIVGLKLDNFLEQIVNYIRQAHHKNPPVQILNNSINFIITILSKDISDVKSKSNTVDEKKKLQNTLCGLGLVKIILSMMCERDINEKVYNHLVCLAVEMLDYGNEIVQNEFYSYFITSEHSEEFFKKIIKYLNAEQSVKNPKCVVYKKKSNNLLKILRLLQLLCENHYSDMQNYLRFQHVSNNSYNIIEAVAILFEKLASDKAQSSFLVFSKCLDTLTEMIQGPCRANQNALISGKFLQVSKKFLEIDQHNPYPSENDNCSTPRLRNWMIVHLKYKLSITLLSLLELNEDTTIISLISRIFPEDLLKKNLNWVYDSFTKANKDIEFRDQIFEQYKENEKFKNIKDCDQEKNIDKYMSIIEVGFNLYHLLQYFNDFEMRGKGIKCTNNKAPGLEKTDFFSSLKKIGTFFKVKFIGLYKKILRRQSNDDYSEKYLKFFAKHTGRVEIAYNSTIHLIYFILRPEALFLTDKIEEEFHKDVDRSSEKSKLQYLLLVTKKLGKKIQNEQWLKMLFSKHLIVSMIFDNVNIWSYISFALTLLLNYLLIASYHRPYFSGIQPRLCLETDKYGDCIKEASEVVTENIFQTLGILHFIFSGLVFLFHALKMGPGVFSKNLKKFEDIKLSNFRGPGIVLTVLFTAFNPVIFYYFSTSIVSLIAVIQKIYPLYCIQMLDIIFRFPSLLNVVKSVYYSRRQLIITYLFIIVVIYYFTLWGYGRLNYAYAGQCPNLRVCMGKTFDRGLKLGMGWVFEVLPYGTFDIERLFFENLYFLVIFTCLQNFIKGIIYDTFFVLRDKDEHDKNDKENFCFICGLERENIEKNSGKSFEIHIKQEHNLWHYAFYMMYVEQKNPTELSSIESYVKEHLNKESILWFPQGEGISILKENKEVDVVGKEIEDLKIAIEKVLNDIEIVKKDIENAKKDNAASFEIDRLVSK